MSRLRFVVCIGCFFSFTIGLCLPAQGRERNRLFPGDTGLS